MEQIGTFFSDLLDFLLISSLWIIGIVLGLILLRFLLRRVFFELELRRQDVGREVVLQVKIPPKNEKKEPAMEEFLKTLHRVLPNNTRVSLEMVSSHQFLRFYVVVPRSLYKIVESQLYAQYEDAEVEEQEDYLLELDETTVFTELHFKHSSIYPFNTYHHLEEGFLKHLSALLSKIGSNDKAYVQIVLRRVGGKPWDRGFQATYARLFGKKYTTEDSPHPVHWKLSQDVYKGKLRLAYTASDRSAAEGNLKALVGLYKTTKARSNEIKKKRFAITTRLKDAFLHRVFAGGDIWTPAEIATIYHFPYKETFVSNVVHTTSKRAPAPDILPREGLVYPQDASFIGETNYRNERQVFGIKRVDRRRHLYIVGKTGSGKSKLLELLIISDIQNGQGCCLIDPHGDLAKELLQFVPKERIKDVIYVDPSDRDFPIGFNPLEPVPDYESRQHLSRFFIAIFKKQFQAEWNPRMEHLIRYITLALLETPDSSVLGIPRMLQDTAFRQRVIQQLEDPVVKGFWTNEFSTSNQQWNTEAIVPIVNKVGQFVANPIVRNMIGQRKNMLNFDKFMNEGKIVIINITKGKLGDDNMALLGAMFITKIQQAALARAKVEEEKRRDFYFYVDEFQNFATEAFSTILSEARKYRLNLTMAHQYIAQLPEDVKATAFGNVGTIIVFPVGGDDAAYLQKEFAPTFTADDMINLNTREMYVKMSVDGRVTTPFSARTINVPKPTFNYSVEIVNNSRMTYGRNRVSVENEIAKWSQAATSPVSSEEGSFPEPII